MRRYLMLASAVALGLSACDEPKPTANPSPVDHSDAETTADRLPAVDAEAEPIEGGYHARQEAENRRKLDLIGANAPPMDDTLRRNERYREYHLVQQRGPAIPGRDFEAQIMCKSVWDAADYNMWALQNLVITGSRQGMTSFLGLVEGEQIEISLVMNEERRMPTFLVMGGSTIAACD